MSKLSFKSKIHLSAILLLSAFLGGCAVKAAKNETADQTKTDEIYSVKAEQNVSETKGKINVTENSPADAIRTFYKNLRENRFREAIFLTNLRPAVEGLTEQELKDLQVDFSNLAKIIPGEIQISGEIVTNDKATVMAKLPDHAAGKTELKEFKLEKQNGGWLILMVDGTQETEIKKQGKNYFFALRIEVHHSEVEKMMDRIYKAQLVYSLQNGGEFTEFKSLIEKNLLPDDVQSPDSTGYKYNLSLSSDKKQYIVTAEPAAYGKTGKFSYLLNAENGKKPVLKQEDKQGKPLKS
ncbi:hypothetical protein BH20ACI4_BH20ACI4_13700 [soil metagenome]